MTSLKAGSRRAKASIETIHLQGVGEGRELHLRRVLGFSEDLGGDADFVFDRPLDDLDSVEAILPVRPGEGDRALLNPLVKGFLGKT